MISKINQKSLCVIWFYRSKRTNLRAAANKLPIDEIYLSDHYQSGIPHFSVIRKVNVSFDPKKDAIYDYFCTRWYSIEDASFDGVTLRKFVKGLRQMRNERSAIDLHVLYQRVTSYNYLSLSSDDNEKPAIGTFYALLESELNFGLPPSESSPYSSLPSQRVKRRKIGVEVIVDLCKPPTNWHLKSVRNERNPNIRPFFVLEIICVSGSTIRLRKFIPVLNQYPEKLKTATFTTDSPKFMVNELYYTNEVIEMDSVGWRKLGKRAVNVEYCDGSVDSALRQEAGDLYFFRCGYQNGEVLPINELINEEKLLQYPSWMKKFPITRPLVAAELYAGSGSMGRGYEQCGVAKVKWSIDVEPCAAATSKANGTADRSILDDAGEILYDIVWGTDSKELSSSLPKPGEIEFLFGGPPCQAFSRANRTDPKTPKNSANAAQLLVFLSWVDVFRPKYVQLENVMSLSNKTFDDSCLFSFVLSFLLKIGYSIRFFWIYAFDYGICQSRCRLILWASKSHLPLPQFPLPTHYVKSRKEIKPEIELPSGERLVTSAAEYINTAMLPCPTLFEIIGNIKLDDPYHFELPLTRQSTVRKLLNQNTNVRRLFWSSLANTVLTTPKLIHPTENRWISVREAARIQGFPDDYHFVTNTDFVADAYKLIGNAVPSKLTFVLGLELRKRLVEVYNIEVEENRSDDDFSN
ncbi:S-adenosyl-L-methionine-dependent methyltransferase [Paraphysoderma sedebokerense]|nr:S-adenosyl-L-methionine-dependent methyltransferase [Paraphysoderma sedebokerense]